MKTKNIYTILIVLALAFSLTGIVFADDEVPPVEETSTPVPVAEEPIVEEAPMLLMSASAASQGQAGTTLTAYKTATGNWEREFNWTIEKTVSPAAWDLFTGDSGTSTYTVEVTKDSGTDSYYVDGQICVTNGGAVATEGLTIWDDVLYKIGRGQFQVLVSFQVDVSGNPVLDPGEEGCYSYDQEFTPVDGAVYKNSARITITNHSGSLGTPKGPSPDADFSLPTSPTLINDAINVDDTNGGTWGFDASGSVSYDKTFTCDGDEGVHENTATIRELGDSDSAEVTVNCYALSVTKDVSTSFDRTYHWNIGKSGDQSSLLLALNQSYPVNYSVVVNMTGSVDSNWAVAGNITISNPAPMDAPLTAVTDVIATDINADVTCLSLVVPAHGELVCSYSAVLPDATTRLNTATATLQNTPNGTTDFSGTASVNFSFAAMNKIDECIDVTDTYAGALGTVCYGVDLLPKTYTYSRVVGPYDTCGLYTVDNTAAFLTDDTASTGSADWTVDINVPCSTGCTLTIGYWKTHAGFGPQDDMVTELLPVWLGFQYVGTNTTAVQFLSFQGSNNIFDPSNGINKLYAQLLAAKLNIASGADDSAVSSTISQANLFLLTKNSTDWAALSKANKAKVLTWAATLDGFNNGNIGPGHCSQ